MFGRYAIVEATKISFRIEGLPIPVCNCPLVIASIQVDVRVKIINDWLIDGLLPCETTFNKKCLRGIVWKVKEFGNNQESGYPP